MQTKQGFQQESNFGRNKIDSAPQAYAPARSHEQRVCRSRRAPILGGTFLRWLCVGWLLAQLFVVLLVRGSCLRKCLLVFFVFY